MILLWLLLGTITLGYLIMRYELIHIVAFAVVWYAIPAWVYNRYKKRDKSSD